VRAPKGCAGGFENPLPKSPTTRRGRHQARPRSVAESGREGDPGTIGLHRNRDDACALHAHAPYPAGDLPRTLEGKMNDFGRLLEREIPRLRRYARALTHDASRADDLVQDTLECLTYVGGYRGGQAAPGCPMDQDATEARKTRIPG